jgi:hypothetical protein
LLVGPKKLSIVLLSVCLGACGENKKSDQPSPSNSDGGKITAITSDGKTSTSVTATGGLYVIEWTWTSPLVALGSVSSEFTIKLPDSAVPHTISDIDIDPWMPSMGHGTYRGDQKITATDATKGDFKAEGLYFTMGGPWELRIDAVVNNKKDRVLIAVDIP